MISYALPAPHMYGCVGSTFKSYRRLEDSVVQWLQNGDWRSILLSFKLDFFCFDLPYYFEIDPQTVIHYFIYLCSLNNFECFSTF
jgi:hypothetical protein